MALQDDPMRPGMGATTCQTGCDTPVPCSPTSACGPFRLRRNDTCPRMEIDVRTGTGLPADLTDWTATGRLFWIGQISEDIDNTQTTFQMPNVANVAKGDIISFEEVDAPRELATVTAVDRVNSIVTVTRGSSSTTATSHAAWLPVIGLRSSGIPVDITQEIHEGGGQFGDGGLSEEPDQSTPQVTATKLVVKWRAQDTAVAGRLLLEIVLASPAELGLALTLPVAHRGYPVRIAASV